MSARVEPGNRVPWDFFGSNNISSESSVVSSFLSIGTYLEILSVEIKQKHHLLAVQLNKPRGHGVQLDCQFLGRHRVSLSDVRVSSFFHSFQ